MKETIIKTNNLSKTIKKNLVLYDININIKKGDIYGFIGQNGAGKTTVMKIISGLIYPTDGKLELFGESSEKGLNKSRKRIGVLIEIPALYLDMTAKENLEVVRIQKGIPGKSCVDEKLELVGLKNVDEKLVKEFSLGMKQRLGIAIALLSDPEILILDEPVNGLDPRGILEIRNLLRKLNEENEITILISSHLLGELHQLATCYGIINNGRLVQELTLNELNERCKKLLKIKVNDINKAVVCLENDLQTTNFKILMDNTINLYDYTDNQMKVSKALINSDVIIEELTCIGEDLESYFVNLIGGNK